GRGCGSLEGWRALEPMLNACGDPLFEHIRLDALDDFVRKSGDDELSCAVFWNGAACEVEDLCFIESTEGRSVTCFDVVRCDFELGSRVGARLFGKEQVIVELFDIDLLCIAGDQVDAVENAVRFIIDDGAAELIAQGMGGDMVVLGTMVEHLASTTQCNRIEETFTSWLVQEGCVIVPSESSTCGERKGTVVCISLDTDARDARVPDVVGFFLGDHMFK